MTATRPAVARRPALRAASVLLLPLLAGCGSNAGRDLVAEAPARFAGMDRNTLVACAGQPAEVQEEPGGTVLLYELSYSRSVDIGRPDPGPQRIGAAPSAIPPPSSVTYRRSCSARFLIRDGRVAAAEFQGRGAGGDAAPEACEPFLKRCLRQR